MSQKIAVIGDKDSILPFRLFDFDVYYETKEEKVRKLIRELQEKNVSIIFITESVAIGVSDVIEKLETEMTPAILLIPNIQGSQGIGLAKIQENVERAVGQNIL
ncbi:V/A-type H+-transporting ATPase subunit F [Pilibacter termitis]|uniref:V/A-type H+-transporting ATPase subunit F n=1 Tax=Pilibacter termitis TaxID=263852 RepID=A0A1T4K4A0_9ENTE|nr:V-type ATP synthase subunit F [Pilibacter termitis]SJZ37239.1 V/A-type H+-transporting ATPase subunit F [Pilibacter termitis]